ncbi:MAG: protein translocase subunit SecD [Deltaproteobacteria bacterium]
MRRVSKAWVSVILVVAFLSLIFLVPTILGDRLPSWWSKIFPAKGISLGLDLKGGVFLVLGVESGKAIEHELANLDNLIREELGKGGVLIKDITTVGSTLNVNLFSASDMEKAKAAAENYRDIAAISEDELSIAFTLKGGYIAELQKRAIDQVQETITNRVDEFGLVEPTIQSTGSDRILIQVPGAGAADRERIINIIRRAAVLEFKIVKDAAPTQETILAKYGVSSPAELQAQGASLHPGDTGQENEKFFVTERDAKVTGQYLSDARLVFDEYGRPAVGFSFKGEGSNRFGELTGENVGRRLAIVLDGVIKSAPVIQERISSQGRITGSFSLEEARDLGLVLRSGALPVPVDVEQEQTVGPSLGRDSIEKGKMSMIVGGIAVVVFMIFFYRLQGAVADIALALNMFFIMGFLSAFGVTLTLPGIAGLVLTMGMALDGNIIIFERIKEELRGGRTPLGAIEAGYQRSFWTVFDANLTTLLTGLILFWFGTGPIKGFAATLCIGIVSTVFSNVVVARVISDYIYGGDKKVTALSI